MGPVQDHMGHHDDPESLPLLTETARVVDLSALDHSRSGEVRRTAAAVLYDLDRSDLVDEDAGAGEDEPPHVDWDGVDRLLESAADGRRQTKLSHLAERYHRPYPSLLSITVEEEDEPIEFVPGQYLSIRFHEVPRPYSVASSPNDDDLEFCVRRVPGGRLTGELFEHLETGDEVTIRGPNGDFVIEDPSSRDLAFLATGTGVAPLRSMIKYTFEEGRDSHDGEPRDVWLFLGTSWADDLAYREFFRTLADREEHFHFVPTCTREQYLTDWQGETAYVQQTLLQYLADDAGEDLSGDLARFLDAEPATDVDARIDPSSLEVYACGVNAMVRTLVDVATRVGVPERHVHGEGYG